MPSTLKKKQTNKQQQQQKKTINANNLQTYMFWIWEVGFVGSMDLGLEQDKEIALHFYQAADGVLLLKVRSK